MYYPSKDEFIKLAKKGNLIPVCLEINADIETPISAFKKIQSNYSFLLESVEGGEDVARYSFLSCDPGLIFKSKSNQIEIIKNNKKIIFNGNPMHELKKIISKFKPVNMPGLPRFHGGLVGYIGYEAVRFFEKIPNKNKDYLGLPDIQMILTDTFMAFDHVKRKIIIISNAHVEKNPETAYKQAIGKIDKLSKKLKKTVKLKTIKSNKNGKLKVKSLISKADFIKKIKTAKKYIRKGDIIQVVLSNRFESKVNVDPFDIYRQLRSINPSPYMYYLSFGDLKLIGASPEVMVRMENDLVTLRPIAGTRQRGKTAETDKKLIKDLLSSVKEKAEHLMLVDLGRNDIGRVCEPGSIKINDYMTVEKYSHVMHIVSQVNGKIRENKDSFDLFAACFPAGTVSGAPKVRAMEIIDEIESSQRGPYAGAVGYFSFSGEMDTCINIRTIVLKKNTAYIQSGAGIVFDSNPEKEVQEINNKAQALFKAIANAKE
ncbi:MAG: anthranilate synthase component I [bacterium]